MLPPEIAEFFRVPGRALLVKGRAGTGKTLFAMELAGWYQGEHGDILWVSSREEDPVAAAQLEKLVPPSQRVRAVDAAAPLEAALDAARPDLGAALAVLQEVAQDVRTATRPLVLLDSLDGVASGLDEAERDYFVRAAVHLARSMRLGLVLVLEGEDDRQAAHLVDGVVTLGVDAHEGARLRELRIEKLRGTPVRRPSYAFTLAEGRFEAVAPRGAGEDEAAPLRPHPRADAHGRVSTAVPEWDRLLDGGLARGSTTLLELGGDAPLDHERLLAPLLVNALNLGRGVLVLTPLNQPREAVEALARRHAAASASQRLVVLDGAALLEAPRYGDRGATPEDRLAPLDLARERLRAHGPLLGVLSVDALAAAFGRDAASRWLASWTHAARRDGAVTILLASSEAAPVAAAVKDAHWRLDAHLGAATLRGRAPETGLHFVRAHASRGFPEAELRPVQ